MAKPRPRRVLRPAQAQHRQPGRQAVMRPQPQSERATHHGSDKLAGKVALITGGDSGIGRAVAIAFAREGADVVIGYLDEHDDAAETLRQVEEEGRRGLALAGDIGREAFCRRLVRATLANFGRLDIVVNNAAEQHEVDRPEDLDRRQLERTFRTNIFAGFHLTRAALPHLRRGSAIVNTTSVTAYRGSPHLLDYSATKGAIVAWTRSLALALVDRGIRVNAVAPGPIWTPLIPASFRRRKVATFGSDTPMRRAGEPAEVAPCYVFLASEDASYMTGQVRHPTGGEIINA
jgi:NAD(P)-dependent dehydrogenase (short-subunit alcohol dehydrogenase family)